MGLKKILWQVVFTFGVVVDGLLDSEVGLGLGVVEWLLSLLCGWLVVLLLLGWWLVMVVPSSSSSILSVVVEDLNDDDDDDDGVVVKSADS